MRRVDHPKQEHAGEYQRHYWNQQWTSEDEARASRNLRREGILPIAKQVFPAGSRLLEAGCGSGKYLMGLSRLGYRVTGVDFAREGLRVARGLPGDFSLTEGSVVRMPYANATFDGALSLGVVEHFEDGPSPAIAELSRVIRPGGCLLLTVPYQHLLWDLGDLIWPPNEAPGQFYQYLFRANEMRRHIEGHAFRIRRVVYLSRKRGLEDFRLFAPKEGNSTVAARATPRSPREKLRFRSLVKQRLPALAERLRDAQLASMERLLPGPLCAHLVGFVAERTAT